MKRLQSIIALIAVLVILPFFCHADVFQGIEYKAPEGWKLFDIQGVRTFTPLPDMSLALVLGPPESLDGVAFQDWLDRKLKNELADGSIVTTTTEPKKQQAGDLQTATLARVVRDPKDKVTIRVYYAFSDGKQAGISVAVTGSQESAAKYVGALQTFNSSLHFSGAPVPAAPSPNAGMEIQGSWSSTGYYGDIVDPATGAFQTTAYSGDWYEFRKDGTYHHMFIGGGQFISGASVEDGTYNVSGNQVVLHRQRSSWYPMPQSASHYPKFKDRVDRTDIKLPFRMPDASTLVFTNPETGTSTTLHRAPQPTK